MKKRFLVAYDYGQGAVWAYVLAGRKGEIESRFPELSVVDEPPGWMSTDDRDRIERETSFDLDDRLEGLLLRIVEQRRSDGRRDGAG